MRKSVITAVLAGASVLAMTACTPYDVPSDKPSTPDLPTGVAPAHAPSATPSTSATAQASGGGHNDADITFAQRLSTQHGYAGQLATLVSPQGGSQPVADLAKRVLAADQPEVKELSAWLSAWGSAAPATGGQAPGEAGAQQLAALKQARGSAFDSQWLQAMIAHHKGELALANAEQANGVNPDAKALALRLISTEQQEIAEMTQLLGR